MKQVPVTIRIDEDLWRRIRHAAVDEHVSVQHLLGGGFARLCREMLELHANPAHRWNRTLTAVKDKLAAEPKGLTVEKDEYAQG